MHDNQPLYNSRITKTYINYLSRYYPGVDINDLLADAGIESYQVEDPAHWFTQRQVDRFQDSVLNKTGNPDISREVGRYIVSSEGMGAGKAYILGLMGPAALYTLMEKNYRILSRGVDVIAKKRGAQSVEIISTPRAGVEEKPYQCANRAGTFESLAKLFTSEFADVQHPQCIHRGDPHCRYIVTWKRSPSHAWRRMSMMLALSSLGLLPVLYTMVPPTAWLFILMITVNVEALILGIAEHLERKRLEKTLGDQKAAAEEFLAESEIRYGNALLTEELGRAISKMLDMNALLKTVVCVMEKRLGFDRGLIMLADADTHALRYAGGYGHVPELEPLLQNLSFSLDKADAKGVFVRAMHEHKPFLIPDIGDIQESLSPRSIAFARAVGCQSLICVPIIYEKQALGILAVDNSNSRRRLQQSDVSYLMGAASQIAVSIINARAFEKLGISEKKYRELVETANSIILRVDTTGRITFFNTFAREFFGFDARDPEKLFADGIITTDGSYGNGLLELVETLGKNPEHPVFRENKTLLKTGNEAWIAWTYKPIFDDKGNFLEILCIGNDISDFKKADQERTELQLQLQRAQKLEAIGTLAGGVAHDLNNILSGIVSYPDLLLMDLPDASPLRKPILTIQKSGERAAAIVQDLLTLARRGVESSTVLNLNDIVSDCLKSPEISRLAASHPGVTINSRLDPALMNSLGSPGHLAKTVTNLVSNALESLPGAGCITLTTENRHLDRYTTVYDDTVQGDFAVLEVSDTGVGLSEQDRERIFEPFYTKKVMGRSGTGLGMAVAWGIVKDHRGYIDISGRKDAGTVISLYFPLTGGAVRDTAGTDTLKDIRGKGERILVVDDLREQREIATELLKMLGYTVNSVPSGEAAVEFVTQTQVDLLVLDMIMEPGIDGLETYRRILEFRPGQKAIIASGYSESERVQELKRLGAGAYIRKPYRIEVIGRAVRAELDR